MLPQGSKLALPRAKAPPPRRVDARLTSESRFSIRALVANDRTPTRGKLRGTIGGTQATDDFNISHPSRVRLRIILTLMVMLPCLTCFVPSLQHLWRTLPLNPATNVAFPVININKSPQSPTATYHSLDL